MRLQFQALVLFDSWVVRKSAAGFDKRLKTGSYHCSGSRVALRLGLHHPQRQKNDLERRTQ
jgi:hypothetical protein